MLLEIIGFVVLGVAVGWAATRAMPGRFPSTRLVWATGPAAGLLGGLVARSVLGPGYALVTLAVATGVSVAMVTLLVRPRRPAGRTRHA